MENVIRGVYVLPPAQYSAIVPKPHNFGYSNLLLPSMISKSKMEFLNYSLCRESLNVSRYFIGNSFQNVEQFTRYEYKDQPFFYYPDLPIELVSLILGTIEDNIGVKTRAKIQITDEDGVIAIFPGRFWGGVAGRFGLFTCLLRACCRTVIAQKYKEVNWEDSVQEWITKSIYSDEYLANTRKSVLKFMEGNTFVTNITVSGDWNYWMREEGYQLLVDPTKFTHDQYVNYIKDYAYFAWVSMNKPSGYDKAIWDSAERYASINACR